MLVLILLLITFTYGNISIFTWSNPGCQGSNTVEYYTEWCTNQTIPVGYKCDTVSNHVITSLYTVPNICSGIPSSLNTGPSSDLQCLSIGTVYYSGSCAIITDAPSSASSILLNQHFINIVIYAIMMVCVLYFGVNKNNK